MQVDRNDLGRQQDISAQFPTMHGKNVGRESIRGYPKEFQCNDTGVLELHGMDSVDNEIIAIESVSRLGRSVLPEKETRSYPLDMTFTRFGTEECFHYMPEVRDDGTDNGLVVLHRGACAGGIWQSTMTVAVYTAKPWLEVEGEELEVKATKRGRPRIAKVA